MRETTRTALVGDVVASRRFVDQVLLLDGLDARLATVNARVPAVTPLRLVAGDRFHGLFAEVGDAVEAALRLRLLTGDLAVGTVDDVEEPVDVRVGIGRGAVAGGDDGESPHAAGPAWWRAGEAREQAEQLPGRSQWPPSLRTVFRDDDDPAEAAAVNAYLLCQDQLFARMDARDRRALLGLLDGERQVDVAAELGVTQPAIARRLRERGALAIHRGLQAMRGVPD